MTCNFTGLAGGSASGKTTVATQIIEMLGVPWVSVLSMDSFYKVGIFNRNHKVLIAYGMHNNDIY